MTKGNGQDAIGQIMQSLIADSDATTEERIEELLSLPEMVDILESVNDLNPEHFDLLFNLPLREGTETLLANCFNEQVIDKPRLIFLFSQSRFIENHFTRLFQQHEETQHAADMARILLRGLAHFFATGEPINFDYSRPNTHLPKKILTHHQAIYEFFEALYRLYHGQPELYLHQLGEIFE